jgi:hypothetical protein
LSLYFSILRSCVSPSTVEYTLARFLHTYIRAAALRKSRTRGDKAKSCRKNFTLLNVTFFF